MTNRGESNRWTEFDEANVVKLDFRDLGSLNFDGLRDARERILLAVDKASRGTVLVDIGAHRAGARLLGILAEAASQSRQNGGRLAIRSAAPLVREMLRACNLQIETAQMPSRHVFEERGSESHTFIIR